MPSNNELIAEALALAAELKLEVKTDGLSNKDLNALVSDLKAKKKDAELKTEADQKAQAEADAKAQLEADQKAQAEADAKAQLEADQLAQAEADAKAQLEADQKAQAEADAKADVSGKRATGVYVEQGKAVTSKIGILTEGAPVEAKHFVGGEETLGRLIAAGVCVEVK